MTKETAEQQRQAAIAAVVAAQAHLGQARNVAERAWLKQQLDERLAKLALAKSELRKINLLASGAKPIEAQPPTVQLTTEALATRLLESFQQLLIADPNHATIRTLRHHFDLERPVAPKPPPGPLRLPPPPPRPTRRREHIPYLDAAKRQVVGVGAHLHQNGKE
jgi:hypothetical protein